MWQIEFYEMRNGKVPVKDFLDSISFIKMKAKVIRDIELLEIYGNELGAPHSKAIKYKRHTMYELRSKQGTNIIRIFYTFKTNHRIVLLHGFVKKSNQTSKKEVEKAFKYFKNLEN